MGKFDSRINSLIRRTHGFISHEDFCVVLNYFQQRLEEEEKPADFDERVRELELLRVQLKSEDPVIVGRFREMIRTPAIWLKAMIPDVTKYSETYPEGVWLSKSTADWFQNYTNDARSYFKDRKKA